MSVVFGVLAGAAGLYSLLIFIKIIFSWFTGMVSGKPVELLNKITDPYLDWWRRRLNLRFGNIDFSALAAIVCLYLVQNIFSMLSSAQRFSIGGLLAIILGAVWSIISFITGFCLVILILRAISYFANRNTSGPFWGAIETISQPLMYNINRIIFGRRTVNYKQGIIVSLAVLALIMIAGSILVNLLSGILYNLPI